MTKKQKKMLRRILVSAALMVGLLFVPATGWLRFALWLVPYLIIGWDILYDAVRGIINGQVFDENFLMAVATVGAMALGLSGSGDYRKQLGSSADGNGGNGCGRRSKKPGCRSGPWPWLQSEAKSLVWQKF